MVLECQFVKLYQSKSWSAVFTHLQTLQLMPGICIVIV
jgi:hypothetical protein